MEGEGGIISRKTHDKIDQFGTGWFISSDGDNCVLVQSFLV